MRLFRRSSRQEGRTDQDVSCAEPVKRLLSYQVANLQGVGTRAGQEDSFAFANAMDVTQIRNQGLFALVADGMGGMEDGKQVSSCAVDLLLEDFQKMDRSQDMGRQLRESICRTSRLLYERFGARGGTTLVACIFYQEMLYFASVGDSGIYLKRQDGIFRMNREQTCRQDLYLQAIEEGSMDPSRADADPDGPRLSQFLGIDVLEDVDISYRPWRLRDGDTLLLCSDGIDGVLTEQMLRDCMSGTTPDQCCRRMEQEIQAQGRVHQDNYTALVVACKY